jgi:hypothetical protein
MYVCAYVLVRMCVCVCMCVWEKVWIACMYVYVCAGG